MDHATVISHELNLKYPLVSAVIELLDQGSTIPFIARYRKEKTGSMDEVVLTTIRDRLDQLNALEDRKASILKSLSERDLLTDSLKQEITDAATLTQVEDRYEQYRPKKKTRASVAMENGLGPLADLLMQQSRISPEAEAKAFLNPEKGIHTPADALDGARDIIAQQISDDPEIRTAVRSLFTQNAQITSAVKKTRQEEGQKYKDYFDWSEPAFKAPSHRVLAMLRGQAQGILTLHLLPDEDQAIRIISRKIIQNSTPAAREVQAAIKDGYKRLLSKSIEKEMLKAIKQEADQTAIQVFAKNLKEILLFSPLGQKRIIAIDPGFRTGCKLVCIDTQGKLRHHDVIYPHQADTTKAAGTLNQLVNRFNIQAIAVGNGTAGRETERFVKEALPDGAIPVIMVDESGASIYSASTVAREEFPDHDITVRGAVSIGRRLMDPLAELVKLDPKSIGVGQYQHDVDPKALQKGLDDVVLSCVNAVGVEVNTASKELLKQVAGLNATLAANLVKYRNKNGPFKKRKDFLNVPRLGPKAFEQAAGFLRIHGADNPLDQSGIHPESYPLVRRMAKDLNIDVRQLMKNPDQINRIDLNRYITDAIGLPTLNDIKKELAAPGRDPRKQFETFSFDETIHDIKDLVPGMRVPGIVTNVTAFGAFVDIGVHQDGLVHISQMANRFVKDPNDVVSVRQTVQVKVLEVDIQRNRISLSLKD